MEKPNITPGLWSTVTFLNDDKSIESITVDRGEEATKIIASLHREDIYEKEIEGNAKAISAVPQLIEELMQSTKVLQAILDTMDSEGDKIQPIEYRLKENRHTLKKAGVRNLQ